MTQRITDLQTKLNVTAQDCDRAQLQYEELTEVWHIVMYSTSITNRLLSLHFRHTPTFSSNSQKCPIDSINSNQNPASYKNKILCYLHSYKKSQAKQVINAPSLR